MINYIEKTLDELGTVGRGKSKHRPRDAAFLYGGQYPFIQTADVKSANLYINSYTQTYSEEGLKQSKLWPKGTLCITIAANIADTAILDIEACFPDSVIGFIANEEICNVKYIKYYLSYYQRALKQISQGVAQDNLNLQKLLGFKFKMPDKKIQDKVVNILSAYDDLIESNLKRIKLLEESAELLYKEWFVNFRYPGYKHKVDNTGMPHDWGNIEVKQFGDVITGKTPSTKKGEYYGGDVKFIKTPDMNDSIYVIKTNQTLTEEGAKSQEKKCVPRNSILVSCIGTVGVVSLTSELSQFNQQINALVPFEEEYVYYLYFKFKSLKETLEALGSSGATMINVNKGKFESIKILNPDKKVIKLFYDQCDVVFRQILNLQYTNEKLVEARDILIPKLITGEIEV